jgi:HK97 gp10 family phage protein
MTFEIEWNGDQILKDTRVLVDNVSKEIAENIEADAKKILKRKAKTTTEKGLLDQFYVDKSKFKNGGYLVWCQGPKNWHEPYHASFFEMGTYKDEAKPFMRPAAKKNKAKAKKMYQDGLNKL